jgi:hypothetical protein
MRRIRGKADGRVGCRRISAMPMDGRELDGLELDERDWIPHRALRKSISCI